jgi:hypothetical protein
MPPGDQGRDRARNVVEMGTAELDHRVDGLGRRLLDDRAERLDGAGRERGVQEAPVPCR